MLEVRNLSVHYGAIPALQEFCIQVPPGKIVTLIGANGAGKSTLLRTISGLVRAQAGKIIFEKQDMTNWPAHRVVSAGIAHVPEGRMIFGEMSVRENLLLGAYTRRDRAAVAEDQEFVLSLFPRLQERWKQAAGTMSGGEQQMLAIGRALMSGAKLLMLDEPSLGLAPLLTAAIFEKLGEINQTRQLAILLVEQNANLALQFCHYAYVLETGRVTVEGKPEEIQDNPKVREAYLGG